VTITNRELRGDPFVHVFKAHVGADEAISPATIPNWARTKSWTAVAGRTITAGITSGLGLKNTDCTTNTSAGGAFGM